MLEVYQRRSQGRVAQKLTGQQMRKRLDDITESTGLSVTKYAAIAHNMHCW